MRDVQTQAANDRTRATVFSGVLIALLLNVALSGCGGDCDDCPVPTQTPTAAATPTATVSLNQPPVLAPIGDRTVVFGSDLLIPRHAPPIPRAQPVTLSAAGLPENSYFLPTRASSACSPTTRGSSSNRSR